MPAPLAPAMLPLPDEPKLDELDVAATAINRWGDVVGRSVYGGYAWLRTADGGWVVERLPVPDGFQAVYPRAVSDGRVVVGDAHVDDWRHSSRPVVWHRVDGCWTVSLLPTGKLGVVQSETTSVDGRGRIVGRLSVDTSGDGRTDWGWPASWTPGAGGYCFDDGLRPRGAGASATVAAGDRTFGAHFMHAAVWDRGQKAGTEPRELVPGLELIGLVSEDTPVAVNAAGVVVGYGEVRARNGQRSALLWQPVKDRYALVVLPALDADSFESATGVSDGGVVVGRSLGRTGPRAAAAWVPGVGGTWRRLDSAALFRGTPFESAAGAAQFESTFSGITPAGLACGSITVPARPRSRLTERPFVLPVNPPGATPNAPPTAAVRPGE